MDYAEDPQHPHEDLIDPVAGGLKLEFPQGRTPQPCSEPFPPRGSKMRCSWFDVFLYAFAIVLLIPLVLRLIESIRNVVGSQ